MTFQLTFQGKYQPPLQETAVVLLYSVLCFSHFFKQFFNYVSFVFQKTK